MAAVLAVLTWPAAASAAFTEQVKLTPPPTGADVELGAGNFGYSAAISGDGNTALVGAYADDGLAGAAWVFTRTGGEWTEQAKLTAPTTGSDKEIGSGEFGIGVALSADGNVALIGGSADNGSFGAGWVFTRSGATWTERAKLVAATTGANKEVGSGQAGYSVALSADGSTAFLGAPTNSTDMALNVGGVFVFAGSGASWSAQSALLPGFANLFPAVGHSIAASSDGNTVVAGGPTNSPSGPSGVAWVWDRSGATWSAGTALLAPDPPSPLAETLHQSELGASVAMSADGNVVLAGGPDDGNANRGAAWVFVRSGGTWPAVAKLVPPSGQGASSQFGISSALSADGGTALIGGIADSASVGAVWLYTGSGATWTERQRVTAPAGTESGGGQFGSSIALSPDAETAVIGGNQDAGPGGPGAGGAWVFVNPPSVSNVNPPSGPASGGTAVTVTGTNLGGASSVAFGGVPATSFSVVSPTQINAISPPGDPAPVDVTVTTPAGASALGLADRFTYFPSPPGAPTTVTARAGNKFATVSFTAPRANGSAIASYRVVASPGRAAATGNGSPITVTGLKNGTRYTFTVTATNGIGTGPPSIPSNAVVPTETPPTVSHVSVTGAHKHKPRLSFRVTAAHGSDPLKSIAVTVPKGLAFAKHPHRGISVGAKHAQFTAKVKHGVLTLTLRTAKPTVKVNVSPPALRSTKTLSGKIALTFTIVDSSRTRTRLTSKLKVH